MPMGPRRLERISQPFRKQGLALLVALETVFAGYPLYPEFV